MLLYLQLLLYALAGMFYWLIIEVLQTGLTHLFPLSDWHGYVAAMAISWLPLLILAASHIHRRYGHFTPTHHKKNFDDRSYIEHTPIYDQYRPRFY